MGKFKNIWNRSKDGANKEERSFLRFAIVVTLIFLVFFCVIKRDNLFRWIEAGFTVRSQEKQIEFYEADIQRLQDEVKNLTTDKDSLKKYAREKFLFAEPGEDVYIEE
ncbi:MAG: septum formation initiator family protein [Bacteroidia bacterium]|nr:septum formation initiator family protein [Bacteroidia bacterium]